jgi:hypothetical protein
VPMETQNACLVAKFSCRVPQEGPRQPNPSNYIQEHLAYRISTEPSASRHFSQAIFYAESPQDTGFAFLVRFRDSEASLLFIFISDSLPDYPNAIHTLENTAQSMPALPSQRFIAAHLL